MPLPIVPPSLLHGHGLFAHNSEPHAQPGNHLRVTHHPLLGLPVAPYIVWRGILADDRELKLRNGVFFADAQGRQLSAPFKLAPDTPVTATLVLQAGDSSIWARVKADLSSGGDTFELLAEAYVASLMGPVAHARRNSAPFAFSGPGIVQIKLTGTAIIRGIDWMDHAIDPGVEFNPWAALNLPITGGVRYASIENPVLHATARLTQQSPKKLPLHETLGMVAPSGAPPTPAGYEVLRVASLTQPLGTDLDSLINDTSEPAHEQVVIDDVRDETDAVIGEVQTSRLQRVLQTQLDPGAASFAGFKTLDSGSAGSDSGLVFYWIDAYFADPGVLPAVANHIGGVSEAPLLRLLIDNLSARNRIGSKKNLINALIKPINAIDNVSLDEANLGALEQRNDYLGFGTLVVIDVAAPSLPVPAPRIESHRQVGWLPDEPYVARREVRLDINGVGTGHLLAAEKRTLDADNPRQSLNPGNDAGFHLPVALGVNTDDESQAPNGQPGSGFLSDRHAAEVNIRYGVAQQDRFGRWSNWHSVVNAPDARPSPPRPVLEAYYTQPALPDPTTSPIDAGTLRVRVAIPPAESLAPASYALRDLELEAQDLTSGSTATRVIALPDPIPADERLDSEFPAPRLLPTERRQLRLRARWRDDSGRAPALSASTPSEPVTLTLSDPRAPVETINVIDDLSYSARPDITGLAVIEHDWMAASASTRYAVYYSDDNRLLGYLQDRDAAGTSTASDNAALAALNAAADRPARAGALRQHATVFPAHLFERLDNAVTDLAGNQRRFQHTVSGSLRVLNVYRVSAESEINARPDISTLPLIIYAVPSDDPPPVPVLRIEPLAMASNTDAYAVSATVSLVSAGSTPAARCRLRRSNLGATETRRMPIVSLVSDIASSGQPTSTAGNESPTQTMGTAVDGKQLTTVTDRGALLIKATTTLQPWIRYFWIAEVQGEDAPGSSGSTPSSGQGVRGLWSAPSAPVSLILIPPDAPGPVQQLVASGIDPGTSELTKIRLMFSHTESLSGGVQGTYRARIYRRLPDADFLPVKEVDVHGQGPFELDATHPETVNESVPIDTLYRVTIIDPIGRTSEPVDTELSHGQP